MDKSARSSHSSHETISNKKLSLVITATSLGTVFEWYDFYLYGSLAVFFGTLFFPTGNETAGFLASLATFGAGFAVRPFGALLFGRMGDLVGRKHTFLVTMTLMGLSTTAVGLLPTYEMIGIWAPILLVTLRLIQGLALGGEYGGAATYIAEHAPKHKRGEYTSWIQTTATFGLLLSLAVLLTVRHFQADETFKLWGWRIPFIVSLVLLAVSLYIRLQLQESPLFAKAKLTGDLSTEPLKESFATAKNFKLFLIALLGATAGQGVVWYCSQFYALYFLQQTLKIDYQTVYLLVGIAIILATPFFIFFGKLSDILGRKTIILTGFVLACVTYIPIFQGLTYFGNYELAKVSASTPIVVQSDHCNVNIFAKPVNQCDKARDFLSKAGISYKSAAGVPGQELVTNIGATQLIGFDAASYQQALDNAGFPKKANPDEINKPMIVFLLFILIIYVTMVYGPIAAFLVEMFPTRIRYSAISLPYHIGNGWFGGFLPFISAAIVVATGNIYAGLYYPITIAVMSIIIGILFIRDRTDRDL